MQLQPAFRAFGAVAAWQLVVRAKLDVCTCHMCLQSDVLCVMMHASPQLRRLLEVQIGKTTKSRVAGPQVRTTAMHPAQEKTTAATITEQCKHDRAATTLTPLQRTETLPPAATGRSNRTYCSSCSALQWGGSQVRSAEQQLKKIYTLGVPTDATPRDHIVQPECVAPPIRQHWRLAVQY